jgi:hypothetical protein
MKGVEKGYTLKNPLCIPLTSNPGTSPQSAMLVVSFRGFLENEYVHVNFLLMVHLRDFSVFLRPGLTMLPRLPSKLLGSRDPLASASWVDANTHWHHSAWLLSFHKELSLFYG